MFYEFWLKIPCPNCQTDNWLYNSHSHRHYIHRCADGFECRKCHTKHLPDWDELDSDEREYIYHSSDLDEAIEQCWIELGLSKEDL